MKKNYLKALFLAISTFSTSIANAQDFEPSALFGLKETYLTEDITCINIKVSTFDYYSVGVHRYPNGKIEQVYGIANPMLEDKEELTTSAVNGNEISYTCKVRKPNDGINTLTTVREEILFFDALTMLDTMLIRKDYDPTSGLLTYEDTLHYHYNGNDNLISIVTNSNNFNSSELYYTGTVLDSIYSYSSMSMVSGKNIYHYTGSTCTSIDHYEFDGSSLVMTGTSNTTQNASDRTIQFINAATTFKFNENCTQPAAINENEESSLLIYPNPAENFVQIMHSAQSESNYIISDIEGKIMAEGMSNGNIIHLNGLLNGIYFIHIEGAVHKIIKQ